MSNNQYFQLFGMDSNKPYSGAESFGEGLKRCVVEKHYFERYSSETSGDQKSIQMNGTHKQTVK